jgi:hypothetical protein
MSKVRLDIKVTPKVAEQLEDATEFFNLKSSEYVARALYNASKFRGESLTILNGKLATMISDMRVLEASPKLQTVEGKEFFNDLKDIAWMGLKTGSFFNMSEILEM